MGCVDAEVSCLNVGCRSFLSNESLGFPRRLIIRDIPAIVSQYTSNILLIHADPLYEALELSINLCQESVGARLRKLERGAEPRELAQDHTLWAWRHYFPCEGLCSLISIPSSAKKTRGQQPLVVDRNLPWQRLSLAPKRSEDLQDSESMKHEALLIFLKVFLEAQKSFPWRSLLHYISGLPSVLLRGDAARN